MIARIAAALALALAAMPCTAQERPPFPELEHRRVVDTADQIPEDVEEGLTAQLKAFQERTGHEMVIVTIPDLKGYPKEDYAYQLGRHWGIGRKGVEDGILMLQSPGDGKPGPGKVYTAVGDGLGAVITDAQAGLVYNQVMLPILKGEPGTAGAGLDKPARVAPAIVAGTTEILRIASITPEQRAEDERRLAMQRAREAQAARDSFWNFMTWVGLVVATALAGFGAWMLATRERRARRRAEEAERQRLLEIALAERRKAEAAAEAERREERRLAAERAQAEREAMLAAMSPADRAAFLAEEERRERRPNAANGRPNRPASASGNASSRRPRRRGSAPTRRSGRLARHRTTPRPRPRRRPTTIPAAAPSTAAARAGTTDPRKNTWVKHFGSGKRFRMVIQFPPVARWGNRHA